MSFNRILVKTIDSFQGGKAAVVIFDTTTTDRPGFLKQRGRLNMKLSQARAAIYVIINMKRNKAKQEQCSVYTSARIGHVTVEEADACTTDPAIFLGVSNAMASSLAADTRRAIQMQPKHSRKSNRSSCESSGPE